MSPRAHRYALKCLSKPFQGYSVSGKELGAIAHYDEAPGYAHTITEAEAADTANEAKRHLFQEDMLAFIRDCLSSAP